MTQIGITERGDSSLNLAWKPWVQAGKPAILITKSPLRLIKHLSGTENVIIHCTITGLGGSKYEPNVSLWDKEILGYQQMVNIFGINRVVLRIDPIIPMGEEFQKALRVVNEVIPGGRIRISFLDMYNHVMARFQKAGIPYPYTTLHAPLQQRKEALNQICERAKERLATVEVCGEPEIPCLGCISAKDCQILQIQPEKPTGFQRPACRCLSQKKELLENRKPCGFLCAYCYWKG